MRLKDRLPSLRATCLLCLVVLTTACSKSPIDSVANVFAERLPFPDKQSTVMLGQTSYTELNTFYWLDNDRVLFVGVPLEKSPTSSRSDHLKSGLPGVYIWNTESNETTLHVRLPMNPYFCFAHGFITYSTRTEASGRPAGLRSGLLGHEQPVPDDMPWTRTEHDQCYAWDSERLRTEHPGALTMSLGLNDGYLLVWLPPLTDVAMRHRAQHEPIEFFPSGATTPIKLPIERKEADFGLRLIHSAYSNQYALIPTQWRSADIGNRTSWPPNEPIPVYLISPNGSVETVVLPKGARLPGVVFTTRKGLFWAEADVGAPGGLDRAGGWLLENGKPRRLFRHPATGATVSPDGCKIAYAVDDGNPHTIQFAHVMNICPANGKD